MRLMLVELGAVCVVGMIRGVREVEGAMRRESGGGAVVGRAGEPCSENDNRGDCSSDPYLKCKHEP